MAADEDRPDTFIRVDGDERLVPEEGNEIEIRLRQMPEPETEPEPEPCRSPEEEPQQGRWDWQLPTSIGTHGPGKPPPPPPEEFSIDEISSEQTMRIDREQW